ncbi:hypothetical protein HYDPIDRAFT_45952, partial [Hydnomerulius pinastri MD-312]
HAPLPSPLRPHCLARDRLRLWQPVESRTARDNGGKLLAITDADLERVLTVINVSWAKGTRESYGAGLLLFHVFCDLKSVPEQQRCPVDSLLILAFVSSCAGSYSGKTLSNYIYAIRAWHILHGQPWRMEQNELNAALDGAAALAPPTSKRPKRAPFTLEIVLKIRHQLDLSQPLDAATYACLTNALYALARLGEFTLTNLKCFDPTKHVKRSDVEIDATDHNGLKIIRIHLPETKVSKDGEDVYYAEQSDLSDPKAAFLNHFAVNNPTSNDPLFAWR